MKPVLQVEGTYDRLYSLSIVNKELALALKRQGRYHVQIDPTEYHREYMRNYPGVEEEIARMVRERREPVDVSVRNIYPPHTEGMEGRIRVFAPYAWEESGFPAEWAGAFNRDLDLIAVVSEHTRKILVDHGVWRPIVVIGNGTDHWRRIPTAPPPPLRPAGFRFLHISSGFPRKGVDILLAAYGAAFRDRDDVSLVLKTFDNPHNDIPRMLEEHRAADPQYPRVELIMEELSPGQIRGLYRSCDALVAPGRAEGFGLPLAEAMLEGLPVVTTAWGGQLDFCDERNALLVDYDFVPSSSHLASEGSVWAEPRIPDLAEAMRRIHTMPREERERLILRARRRVGALTWRRSVDRLLWAIESLKSAAAIPRPQSAWIELSLSDGVSGDHHAGWAVGEVEELSRRITDPTGWRGLEKIGLSCLPERIDRYGPDVVYVGIHVAKPSALFLAEALLESLHARGVATLLGLQEIGSSAAGEAWLPTLPVLRGCGRILVRDPRDLSFLGSLGIVENVTVFPLPSSREPAEPHRKRLEGLFRAISRNAIDMGEDFSV